MLRVSDAKGKRLGHLAIASGSRAPNGLGVIFAVGLDLRIRGVRVPGISAKSLASFSELKGKCLEDIRTVATPPARLAAEVLAVIANHVGE